MTLRNFNNQTVKWGGQEAIGINDKTMTPKFLSPNFLSQTWLNYFIYQIIKNTHNKLSFIRFGTKLSFELDKLMSSTNQGSTDRP